MSSISKMPKALDAKLWEACVDGDLARVFKAVFHGANIHSGNGYALKTAALWGHLAIVKYLVSIGADIHASDDKALQCAASYGYLEIVKYLISLGANIYATNDGAIQVAAWNGRLAIVKYLVFLGADTHADLILYGASENGHLAVIKYLASECSTDIHAEDDYPLHLAAGGGHLALVKYLVSQGANVKTTYAAKWASDNGYYETAAYLASVGAPISQLSENATNLVLFLEKMRPRAQKRIYFWWIQKCHEMSSPSGIRMAYKNLAEYETICKL
jgi:hypothetical protein